MAVSKVDFRKRVLHWFTYHPLLKLLAFGLAILAWFYINWEIQKFNY